MLLRFMGPALLLLSCATGCKTMVPPPAPEGSVAILTHLEGTTAPCGCTSRPLGGLDRIAHAVQTAKPAPVPLLVVGNTFFTERDPSPTLQGFARTTAGIVAGILAELKPASVTRGPWDVGPMAHALAGLPPDVQKKLGWPTLKGPLWPERLVPMGGLQLGVIEAPALPPTAAPAVFGIAKSTTINHAARDGGDAGPAQQGESGPIDFTALGNQAEALRAQGATAIVLLWPHGTQQARALLGNMTGIDLIVAGSEEAPKAPEALGDATLLDGGARGEYVHILHVVRGTGGKVRYFDGGKVERAQAQERYDRFLAEAERLPEGPGRSARLARANAIAKEMTTIATTPPQSAYVTWQSLPMDADLPAAPWATQALDGYNTALCDTAMADTAARTCTPPITPAGVYVGTPMCQGCHQEAYAVWAKTSHAKAWSTLTEANKACDLSCVGCHVVGFEKPGGFCHLADAPAFINVGCESCHGPGLGHIQNPNDKSAWAQNFVRNTPETTCKGCHNAQHSDQFNFATYRPRVLGPGHGLPSALPQAE